MKKAVIVISFALFSIGLSANPLLGIWKWDQYITDNDSGYFQFNENGTCLIGNSPGSMETAEYSVIETEKILILNDDKMNYNIEGDSITFFLSEEIIRDNMIPNILNLSTFPESDETSTDLKNELTSAFIEIIGKYPFLKGLKIDKIPSRRKRK